MAVGSDEDLNARPVATDLAHQPAEETARLGAGRAACGAQHGGNWPALAVERHERLEAVFVVVSVEEAQLLAACTGSKMSLRSSTIRRGTWRELAQ
jgi:hypothetical protein